MSVGNTFSSLTTSRASGTFNNSGARTAGVRFIVVHHNATTSKDVAVNTWRPSSGYVGSAHYEITETEIIGCVGEELYAWHASNANNFAIGLEHVNSGGAPGWPVSEATQRNGARLAADICKRYGLKPDRSVIVGHGELTAYGNATQCPGGIDMDTYVKYVREYYYNQTTASSANTAAKVQPQIKGGLPMEFILKTEKANQISNYPAGAYVYVNTASQLAQWTTGSQYDTLNTIHKKLYDKEIPILSVNQVNPVWLQQITGIQFKPIQR